MPGTVARVSGPVVIAEGLVDAKMYDVVRVGSLGLVGEIIRLVGGTATVQVYEDTTGIRPGDPVENTGQALSVELGPGLLKSIYDGVQRPLDIVQKSVGDFITRGTTAPPLDEKAVWEFTATATVGGEVTPGTILGTVQETAIIVHKILVPPGLRGTLVDLRSGRFTIRDRIGTLRTASGEVPLTLTHKWVVRIPRPVAQKLPPEIPLVTGQRVIDTYFPVAKGGTACIPGPFGSGKCVSGDTPVLLASGEVVAIEKLYEARRAGAAVRVDGNDEWLSLSRPVELLSLVGDSLVRSRSGTLYKGKSDSLLRVRTRSGRTVRVTPAHRLFTFGPDGSLQETEARNLRTGDYLASIRQIPGQNGPAKLRVQIPKLQRHGKQIRVPERMSYDLAEFLGLYVAEGHIRQGRTVVFTNSDEALLDRFLALSDRLFGVRGKVQRQEGKTPDVLLASVQLAHLIDQLGAGRISGEKRIPTAVLTSDNDVLGGFLRGYYLGDGGFSGGEVEFCTKSRRLQIDLSYSLLRYGIHSSHGRRVVNGTEYYRLFVRGIPNLGKFRDVVGTDHPKLTSIPRYLEDTRTTYTATDVVPLTATEINRIYRQHFHYAQLLDDGIEIHNYIGNGERMGTSTFYRFMNPSRTLGSLDQMEPAASRLRNLLEWLFCDEVVDVSEEEGPFDVYDVSLPEYGSNFVGGYGGLLLHNTVTQQQLAKWADSDIVVYVGCGERGNEMAEVLATFPKLQDPKSGRPLMERTVLIANTSNMPVAAREASVYTGITIAEYYRDMGYDVALMADSTSRWAEAMREISGRLEEMPGEEGYPAYLGRRIAEFYERSGRVVTISPESRNGSVTVVGAVSPPGGDTSEPVSQNTLRITRVFWALDASLASRRHFPSINWLQSYSLYTGDLDGWYTKNVAKDFPALRQRALGTLQKEAELQEVVQLVGVDALPEREKAVLDVSRMLREDYLQQSAYDEVDTYTSIKKQALMLRMILHFGDLEQEAVAKGVTVSKLQQLPVRTKLSRMKWIPEIDADQQFAELDRETELAVGALTAGGGS